MSQILLASDVVLVSPDRLPVVVHGGTETDRDAAADLCNYLSRITGLEIQPAAAAPADAAIVIHVGRDAFVEEHAPEIEKLYGDGFVIKGVELENRYHLILSGRMEPASQWAVEQFLKDYCGVRWLFPDPIYGEVVPPARTIAIDRNVSRVAEPDYLSRANLGMYHYNPAQKQLRNGTIGYEYGIHAIQHIFNNGSRSGELFEQHPEWFALFGGKRQWWAYGNGWQICTTHPGTIDHAVRHAMNYFERHPDAPMVSIGPNDGSGWCECPTCTKFVNSFQPPLNVSERWFTWVNQVAKEVGKVYPDKWIESLAYAETSAPPRFPLEQNVAVTKTFVVDGEFDQAEAWSRVCKSVNLYSYMYGNSFLGFRHYPTAARDFLKWGYDKVGARAHVSECGGDWTFDGPKYAYIQALQWDVNADLDAIMNDFCRSSYGAGAEPMRAFWDRLEEVYERRRPTPFGRENRRMQFYQWVGWIMNSYVQPNDEFQEYTADDVEFLDAKMNEAVKLAAGESETVRFRVDRMHDAWRFYRTALASFTRLYNMKAPKVASPAQVDQALALAAEIADLRAERTRMLGAMRLYPKVNPHTTGAVFWGWNEGLVLFNHELTLLDETCFAITRYWIQASGSESARENWRKIGPDSSLYEAARTQLYCLSESSRVDVLVNGDFESGDLSGWESAGAAAAEAKSQEGRFFAVMEGSESAEISQRVVVRPRERYLLSALARYPSQPPADAVALESYVEFHGNGKRLDVEPMRTVLRTTSPQAGWIPLTATVTVPPGATHAVIRLKRTFEGAAQWDHVRFERIQEGIDSSIGTLVETFDGGHLDGDRWFQSTNSAGTRPPCVRDGALMFDSDQVYSLTSYIAFNGLLDHAGADRYRLQLRVARAGDAASRSSLDFAIQSDTGSIRTNVTGLYWTHFFADASQSANLYCYSAQGKQQAFTGVYTLQNLPGDLNTIDYTFDFDRQFVTVHASHSGFDAGEGSQVARYAHGIAGLGDMGNVYVKIHGVNCRLEEIALDSAADRKSISPPTEQPGKTGRDEHDLTMPGVTD